MDDSGLKFAQLEISALIPLRSPTSNGQKSLSSIRRSDSSSTFVFLRVRESDKPVFWNLAAVSYPTVGKDGKQPQLPIKVRALKE